MARLFIFICTTLFSYSSWSSSEPENNETNPFFSAPLIQLNVSVDTAGIERAIDDTNQSMYELVDALKQVGDNRELTPKQMEVIALTVNNINQLTESSTDVMKTLPVAIEYAKQAVVSNSQLFYNDLKFNILLLLGGVVAALVVVIVCLYWFVIRPMQNTIVSATINVVSMAKTIELTAKSLEESNKTHVNILRKLEQE
ncbi:MAG: hypothetical protein JKY55_10965 [Aliivibrio sp.]|uniref:hypothetical protein n=1 Tax=Aliivibrio sp. TaxID=1872443 RepID=UPI001A606901|nr:hypothetical protein [Aliivibrio sp.]